MPKGPVKKEPIKKDIFMKILGLKNSSIRKLGREVQFASDQFGSEKTIRRQLSSGMIRPGLLDAIAKHLDVDKNVLSGKYMLFDYETPEVLDRYPYSQSDIEQLRREDIRETLKRILALYNRSISQFDCMDFELQYQFQKSLLESMHSVVKEYFDSDIWGKTDELEGQRILFELDCYYDDHYFEGYVESLRPIYLEDPPFGYSRKEIKDMPAYELGDVDREIQGIRWKLIDDLPDGYTKGQIEEMTPGKIHKLYKEIYPDDHEGQGSEGKDDMPVTGSI